MHSLPEGRKIDLKGVSFINHPLNILRQCQASRGRAWLSLPSNKEREIQEYLFPWPGGGGNNSRL
jgi:hypothetical protein